MPCRCELFNNSFWIWATVWSEHNCGRSFGLDLEISDERVLPAVTLAGRNACCYAQAKFNINRVLRHKSKKPARWFLVHSRLSPNGGVDVGRNRPTQREI
jgi:hypothetical protein